MLQKIFKELGAETRKEKIILTAKAIVAFIGCCAFVYFLFAFMWACYYAGIPMCGELVAASINRF